MPARRLAPLVLLAILLALGAAACTPKPSVQELDRRLYRTSLPVFGDWWRAEHARAQRVSVATVDRWISSSSRRLDALAARSRHWDVSTDLCSFAPDRGPAFDFRLPCIRHDFAWRNLRRLGRDAAGVDTSARRMAASRQFLRDMQATCARRPTVQRVACRAVARTYFVAVSAAS